MIQTSLWSWARNWCAWA